MLSICKTTCLILMTLTLVRSGVSAQIASAPLKADPISVGSKTTNGLLQEAAAAGKLQDLHIGTGDLLQVTMFGTQDFNADFRVGASGDISLPPLGLVHVA